MRISKLILTILVIVTFSSCSTREDGGQMIGIVKSSISDQEELGLFYFSRIQYYGEHLPYHFHHKLIDDAKWLQKMVDSACTEVYSMSDSEIEKGEGRKCVLKIRTKILKGDSTDSLSAGLESEFHQIAKRQTNQNDSLERLILKSECLRIRNGIFKGLASANGSMCDFGFGFKGLAPTQFDTKKISFDVFFYHDMNSMYPLPIIQTIRHNGKPVAIKPAFQVRQTTGKIGFDSLAPGSYEIIGQAFESKFSAGWQPFNYSFTIDPKGNLVLKDPLYK